MSIDLGILLVRVLFGLAIAAHGAQKLFSAFGGNGLKGTGGYFETLGFRPGVPFAALAGSSELGGGLLLAVGLFTPVQDVRPIFKLFRIFRIHPTPPLGPSTAGELVQGVKPIFKLFRIFRIHPTPPLGPSTAGELVNRLPASPSSADVSRASSSAIDR